MDFPALEEITITHSGLPAIGDSSFWPGRELRHLDLSSNKIRNIRDMDFNGLGNLRTLNLSDNALLEPPSAYVIASDCRKVVKARLSHVAGRFVS